MVGGGEQQVNVREAENAAKFILSGGQPTLAGSSGNTTTGRELTFFLASDTILVDSQNEPRTVTKHRAEK
jgi:hypothetical protein